MGDDIVLSSFSDKFTFQVQVVFVVKYNLPVDVLLVVFVAIGSYAINWLVRCLKVVLAKVMRTSVPSGI